MLRLPEGMRSSIKEAADKNNRTMNAEIVARLQGSFGAATGVGGSASADEILKAVETIKFYSERIDRLLLAHEASNNQK